MPPCPSTVTALPRHQPVLGHDRRIFAAGRRHEAIAETGVHGARGGLVEIDVDAAALVHEQRAQIVDAVGVVGMLMGDQHAVEPIDLGLEQLLAQSGVQSTRTRVRPWAFVRSTNKQQRRLRFFGLFGSHEPQPEATRGTPMEDPQPRMVNLSVMRRRPGF